MLLQLLITTCSWNFYLFTDFLLLAFPGNQSCLDASLLEFSKQFFLQHMRQVVASYTEEQVFTLCMPLEALLWWQNHFGMTLSQLLEHKYHVMHIHLPDKDNVNHFCLQAFLSEQSFRVLFMSCCCSSSTIILLFFKASSNFILAADIIQSQVSSGFFLPVGLVYDTEYFPLQDLN